MPTELSKTYDPAAVESAAYKTWLDEKLFHAEPSDKGAPYCIVIPPPNVTGALHLGHAINNTLQDILTRVHRMRGFNTLWIPGIDHAGIATQAVVEKQLKEQENKTRHDVGREGLVQRIWTWKQQYGDRILNQLQRLGCSCDWDRTRFTLDDICARAVRETFFKLFKDGLVYRGKRLVNWDVHLQTSISDDEIYHETVKTFLWHIRYPIADAATTTGTADPMVQDTEIPDEGAVLETFPADPDSNVHLPTDESQSSGAQRGRPSYMTVATTRPETLLGDTAVAVHSEDPRWNWAIGKFVKLPLTDRLIPIIADDILVDPKFGSGVVKVTPAHDPNDYAVWQRHQGESDQIDLINILNPDGTLNANAGPNYAGMKRDAARKKVVEDLKTANLLAKEEPYETQVGHSDRSKTAVEPYLSDQWFVKMAPLAEPALEVVRNGTIKFFPERHAQQYLSWLGEKRDWPISQLWWGHRIPVWNLFLHHQQGGPKLVERIDAYFREIDLKDHVFITSVGEDNDHIQICTRSINADRALELWNRYYHVNDTPAINLEDYKDVVTTARAWEIARSIMDGPAADPVQQDPDVLDTWFSSGLWPHSTLGWPDATPELQKWYPTSVLLTGRDIITLWVARMVMLGMYNMGMVRGDWPVTKDDEASSASSSRTNHQSPRSHSPAELGIPFHHVAINPTILDGKGERMSKSKGNGVDPVDVIETHGADALRFTLSTMATETQDVRMPVKKDSAGRNTSDKFDLGRNFCNKLWNAARFAFGNLETIPAVPMDESQWTLADRWILSRLARTVREADAALAAYRFDQYAKACYDFFWRDFCDWYVETKKPRLKDPKLAPQAANVLAGVLDATLRLLHPLIPFITETLWWRLNEIRPSRTLPGIEVGHAEPRLIRAAWPKIDPALVSDDVEATFTQLQQVIVAVRNVRNEHKVDPRKTVTVRIAAPAEIARSLDANRLLLEILATCVVPEIRSDLAPVASASRTSAAGCDIYIEGLVDESAERERAVRQIQDKEREIAAMKARLANEGYIAKAPPHLVEQTRQQLAEAETELRKLTGQ